LLAIQGGESTKLARHGGDDYELCISVPVQREAELLRLAATFDVPITRIGEMNNEVGILRIDGEISQGNGYDHFRGKQ
jgi:thiamine-monophosphate kinase